MSRTMTWITNGMTRTKVMHDKNCERSRECDCQKSKSSHHESTSGHDHSRAGKHHRSAEPGDTSEHPCSKE